jgi:hypothetical protein
MRFFLLILASMSFLKLATERRVKNPISRKRFLSDRNLPKRELPFLFPIAQCVNPLRVVLSAGGDFEGVAQQRQNRLQALLSAAFAPRQIHNQRAAAQARHAAREP